MVINKYRNKWTEVDGKKFQSKKEADRYSQLILLQRSGIISDLRTQVSFDLKAYKLEGANHLYMGIAKGIKICTYRLDFKYKEAGHWCYEDVKGMKSGPAYQLFKLKKKWMKAQYGIDVIEI